MRRLPFAHAWIKRLLCLAAGVCMLSAAAAESVTAPLGVRPAHIDADLPEVPNAAAMVHRIWVPGIDDGYVPQGVAIADGQVLISSYRSTDSKIGQGPCRVFRIDPRSGSLTGQFDMPETCGHAGGMVYAGGGMLIVSDTRRLYRIDMASAFREGHAAGALRGTVTLTGPVKGSFIAFDGASVLVGSSEKDASKARAYLLPLALFDRDIDLPIDERAATRSFPIGTDGQGAAFDRDGRLWLTFSNSKMGRLEKLDPVTGAVFARHNMVIGMEDISFDAAGLLWSVSEAGSLRWSRWAIRFPVVFSLDTGRLQ
jgi:hypothetical protein